MRGPAVGKEIHKVACTSGNTAAGVVFRNANGMESETKRRQKVAQGVR